MTNPRIYLPGHPKTFERNPLTNEFLHIDKEATIKLRERPVPTEQEMTEILNKADLIPNEFFRLRAKAIIGLVKIFGKRRIELSLLEMSDIQIEENMLHIIFTIAKKHKKGLHQYLEFLKKSGDTEYKDKSLGELEEEQKIWNQTPEGIRNKIVKRPKMTPLTDKYAMLIYDYIRYVQNNYPDSKFLFPSGKELFGADYMIFSDKGLSGRQILNIIKSLDPNVWTHLFRKQKGSEVARKYGRTLESVFMVKDTLDLARDETAFHYIEENAPKLETGETA